MRENFRFAFQGIWTHKMRSFLTMLGVIIGIASIIAIVSTIKGTNEQIMQNLIGAGNNNVTITLKQGDGDYEGSIPSGVSPVSDDQKDSIRSLDQVADASFYHSVSYVDSVLAGDNKMDGASAMGIDDHYLATAGLAVYEGRKFLEGDFHNFSKVILLDQSAADQLFPDGGAVGSVVEIMGEPFTVAGLVRKSEEFKPVIQSLNDYMTYYPDTGGTIYLPDTSWPILFGFDAVTSCAVRTTRTEAMSQIGRKAADIMNQSVSGGSSDVSYQADDLLERAKNQQNLSRSTNNMLIWIASIALLVGGIGVMNIMLVSVTERTSEIGLKKALGAKKRNIRAQFLTESAVLTGIGGILGVIAGLILAAVISRFAEVPVAVSIPSVILAVAFSALIGIVFGLLPAAKAANLNPIDALRRE